MNNTPTPHIEATYGQIAKTVLMPGDPKRAEIMAKKFLDDCQLVSSTRNNYCFTGKYKGKLVSIMSSGMGMPSMGIYSHELFAFYGVENIIRVGTIGSLVENLKIGDIVIGQTSITDTNFDKIFEKCGESELNASAELCSLAKKMSKKLNLNATSGAIYSTDTFYSSKEQSEHIGSLKVLGIEMESASLYHNAEKFEKNALCLCTVSDEIISGKKSTSLERQNNFDKMFVLALEIAINL